MAATMSRASAAMTADGVGQAWKKSATELRTIRPPLVRLQQQTNINAAARGESKVCG